MQKIQNIVFSAIIFVLLFSVIACKAYYIVSPDAQAPVNSELERRDYTKLRDVLANSFIEGTAQDVWEQYVADGVPARDQILLMNASLQRQGIKTAATALGFSVYPTFFGSDMCVVRDEDILLEQASVASNTNAPALVGLIDTLNDAAESFPNINFSCRFVLEVRQSEANPTYALKTGNLIDSTWMQKNVVDKLSPSLNASVDAISSLEEIKSDFYSTDPHWTLKRALRTYDSVARDLNMNPSPNGKYIKVIPAWRGSFSRVGLDLDHTSTLYDIPTDFTQLHYYTIENDKVAKKERSDPGKRAGTLLKESKRMKLKNPFQGYGSYYGAFNGLITNTGENNGKTCLLIGDSFTHCLKRYIAANYAKTYSILPGNYVTKMSLKKMIETYQPDDVIYLTQAKKYNSFAAKSPDFIGVDSNASKGTDEEDAEL